MVVASITSLWSYCAVVSGCESNPPISFVLDFVSKAEHYKGIPTTTQTYCNTDKEDKHIPGEERVLLLRSMLMGHTREPVRSGRSHVC